MAKQSAKHAVESNRFYFSLHVLALYHASSTEPQAREESFRVAQWALQTDAAEALGQMAARFAKGQGDLSSIVREQQDLLRDRKAADTRLLAAIASADVRATEEKRNAYGKIETQLDEIDARLRSDFPEYATLTNPQPLTIAAARAQLKDDEALIQFLDVPSIGRLPGENFVWLVTKEDVRWHKLSMSPSLMAEKIRTLRCGLDRSNWIDPSKWSESSDPERRRKQMQQARLDRCQGLLDGKAAVGVSPLFDLSIAHELYTELLAPFADLIKDKHLLIVPSGPLTTLPFGVLVTERPKSAFPNSNAGYRDAVWLARNVVITVLPSVGSLSALRNSAKRSTADQPFIGFGNPLLEGRPGKADDEERARLARQLEHCSDVRASSQLVADTASQRSGVDADDTFFLRSVVANVAAVRAQLPLPETAQELCDAARALGVEEQDLDRVVHLGQGATETAIHHINEQRGLEHYRVVQFATHGVLAGQWRGLAEPGLILTPPKDRDTADLEKDDGYLSASEIAQLKLNADWVVLSACNTAAGESGNTEALSGLARAFFFAGARALLVSHWAVKTNAAVKLTTGAFAELQKEPTMGRAEAMRRSIKSLIEDTTSPDNAHPSTWAPFVLVGEGAQAP